MRAQKELSDSWKLAIKAAVEELEIAQKIVKKGQKGIFSSLPDENDKEHLSYLINKHNELLKTVRLHTKNVYKILKDKDLI